MSTFALDSGLLINQYKVPEQFKIFTLPLNENVFTKGTKFTTSKTVSSEMMYNMSAVGEKWTPVIQCYDDKYEYYYCVSKSPFDNNDTYNPKFLKPILNSTNDIVNYEKTNEDQGTELYILLNSDVEFTNSTLADKKFHLVKCRAISISEMNKGSFSTTDDNKLTYIPANIVPDQEFALSIIHIGLILLIFNSSFFNFIFYRLRNKKNYENIHDDSSKI